MLGVAQAMYPELPPTFVSCMGRLVSKFSAGSSKQGATCSLFTVHWLQVGADAGTFRSLVRGFVQCGQWEKARDVFEEMKEVRDVKQ